MSGELRTYAYTRAVYREERLTEAVTQVDSSQNNNYDRKLQIEKLRRSLDVIDATAALIVLATKDEHV